MKVAREQQIAVFGESGSGKTVLLSSFYGAAQGKPAFLKQSLFAINADRHRQGRRLHQFFLGMKNAGPPRRRNRFSATKYVFSVKRRPRAMEKGKKAAAEELRLVWHDYPGEWFEEDPSTPEEVARRAETFSALVGSDVAVLLIDAQRLTDNSGEEERYLKALLTNYISHVSRVRDELLPDGQRLIRFPRVWIFGLSKADLLPDVDVTTFRDLLVEERSRDVTSARGVSRVRGGTGSIFAGRGLRSVVLGPLRAWEDRCRPSGRGAADTADRCHVAILAVRSLGEGAPRWWEGSLRAH